MAALTYVTDMNGDWACLYVDGRLAEGIEQNHSLRLPDVWECLVGKTIESVSHFEADSEEGMADWLGPYGFPEYLSSIPQEARA